MAEPLTEKELEQVRVHAVCLERLAPFVRRLVEECQRLREEITRIRARGDGNG